MDSLIKSIESYKIKTYLVTSLPISHLVMGVPA